MNANMKNLGGVGGSKTKKSGKGKGKKKSYHTPLDVRYQQDGPFAQHGNRNSSPEPEDQGNFYDQLEYLKNAAKSKLPEHKARGHDLSPEISIPYHEHTSTKNNTYDFRNNYKEFPVVAQKKKRFWRSS